MIPYITYHLYVMSEKSENAHHKAQTVQKKSKNINLKQRKAANPYIWKAETVCIFLW